ncbi:MAG: nucleotide exchange factor GrpE [Bacteroidaceae bacterium]|nr:nucleotide exchange factor GrpE [Bacteroidaceae bacterium]
MDKEEKIVNTDNTESTVNTECTEHADDKATKANENTGATENTEDAPKEETLEDKLTLAEARIAELEKERLYKQAEFDNYRKRIIKEKADLILNGGRKVLEAMLPVIDDLERALQHMEKAEDVEAVREGVDLIYKKFLKVMEAQGVTQMDTKDADFNTDFHEAVTQFPAPTDELKGKVIDCTEKGYMLNDTVLRYAKVVVGI